MKEKPSPCQCAYCRSGMQADFVKRWRERPLAKEIKKEDKEVKA